MRTCKKRDIPLHIRTIWKEKHPGGGRISCKIRRKWTAPAPADHPQDGNPGEVCKPERQSLFSLLRNSPPRSHVPHSGTPIRVSQASYRQVRGRGVVLKPGRKNETVKRPMSKIKISAGASAIYVKGRSGLCAALVRWWRHGVDTDVIWG